MTNEEAIKILKGAIKKPNPKDGYMGQALTMAIEALETQPKWMPITERKMTDEEVIEYGLEEFGEGLMYDCPLPEDGEDVIITTPFGVRSTTFYRDYGCYFEDYEDEGEVLAWMSLPEPYKEGENNE